MLCASHVLFAVCHENCSLHVATAVQLYAVHVPLRVHHKHYHDLCLPEYLPPTRPRLVAMHRLLILHGGTEEATGHAEQALRPDTESSQR
jgi:hypothetical protein